MSRSPATFWRSHRSSSSYQPTSHRTASSVGDALSANPLQTRPLATHLPLPGSQSGDHSASVAATGMGQLERRRTVEERSFAHAKSRSPNWNSPIDLRLLDYVTASDDNLECPICRCPFVDPVVLTECDHCFCRDCIRQTWTTNSVYSPLGPRGDCPTCRTPAKLGPRSATSKILVNILDDLMVRCPKSEEGCKVEVKRGEVQDHVSIYCGFALVECPANDCELPVRRKDAVQGCLHFAVSCLACQEEMKQCHLEIHWQSKCPDRSITCEHCKAPIDYRSLAEHNQRLCPAVSIRCPGEALGCTTRSEKGQADIHARSCTFAKLAPIIAAQNQRLNEQEAAQKEMSRTLEVLENGFANMHGIMFPEADDPDLTNADASSMSLLHGHGEQGFDNESPSNMASLRFPAPQSTRAELEADTTPRSSRSRRATTGGTSPDRPPETSDLPEIYNRDFDLPSPFPPPSTNGPYASPLHHLLSLHESLRDEMSRISSALQELDGRHSMHVLNENLRTREEITYIGAQVAGLSRQVHWLTSAQLQKQGRSATPGGGSGAGGEMAAATGPSVEEAISSAVRGAARIVNAGREGMGMRRGPSEEGRTKL